MSVGCFYSYTFQVFKVDLLLLFFNIFIPLNWDTYLEMWFMISLTIFCESFDLFLLWLLLLRRFSLPSVFSCHRHCIIDTLVRFLSKIFYAKSIFLYFFGLFSCHWKRESTRHLTLLDKSCQILITSLVSLLQFYHVTH